jgi:alanine dehydrogenase
MGPAAPPLRYLSAADVERCLPSVQERIDLAERALIALSAKDAEMPPKLGVHPREGALLHAMPAWLRSRDLVGLKWVSAFPGNKAHGLPAITGLVVLNDPETGLPTWIMDAARITAVRTAAVSGAAIRLLAPAHVSRVALLGAGVQARSHLDVVAALLPEATLAIFDRHPDRARALADEAGAEPGLGMVVPTESLEHALDGSAIVITLATLGAEAQRLQPADVGPRTLVVAVDFATYVTPGLARDARLFVVDDREQFLRYRELGYFDDYPEPAATLGELARARRAGSALGPAEAHDSPTLVSHLGVGLADVVLADAVAQRATTHSIGTLLER